MKIIKLTAAALAFIAAFAFALTAPVDTARSHDYFQRVAGNK